MQIDIKIKKTRLSARLGYSLLEIVVYLGLLAIIGVVVVQSIFSVYRAYGRTRVERRINLNGDAAIETMVRAIREATSTYVSASTFGSSPGVLKVGGKTFSRNSTTNALQIDEGAGPYDITTDATLTSLIFYRDATTTSEMIKIELTLSAGLGSFSKTRNFFGGAVLRGKY